MFTGTTKISTLSLKNCSLSLSLSRLDKCVSPVRAAVSQVRFEEHPLPDRLFDVCRHRVSPKTPSATKASRVLSDVTAESFSRRHSRVKTPAATSATPGPVSLSFPSFFIADEWKRGRGYLRLLLTRTYTSVNAFQRGVAWPSPPSPASFLFHAFSRRETIYASHSVYSRGAFEVVPGRARSRKSGQSR